ncbi:hypothetical protein HGM15179_019253 [Zosterops borbonicus]|uniref:ribonuclease H n=1 Tax=Zosterops borbonicus TaxID=364589 RepID=A0A8K1FW31_9PASS|nr:hypothetical protein HGM15179_019253 [Zosterops borbonicus]
MIDQVFLGVWASDIPGRSKNALPVQIKLKEGEQPVRVKQYPLKKEDREGISPIIEKFLKIGLLRECQSDFNTPILPVKKPDGSYRLVQDLRAVNKITEDLYPVVANPYTLLTHLTPELTWFTILDLKDAFFCLPLHEASQKIFAFEWENPKTGRTQLTWCVLPQGYKNCPTIFGEQLAKDLESWESPPGEGQLLQYVDDLLIATQTQETCVDWTHENGPAKTQTLESKKIRGDSLDTIEATYSSRLDLKDTLIEDAETWFTDGSSYVVSGKWHAGYAVTTSSGQVEKMNHLIKLQIVRLGQELNLPWPQALSLALLRIRTKPRAKEKLSPFEILYGRPYAIQEGTTPMQVGEETLYKYMVALNRQLREIEKYVAGAQNRELDGPVHDIQPGDYVYVKSFAEKTLEPQWEGPFQVLLTTFTAIKIKEQKAWIYHSRVKKAPEGIWKITPGDKELKLKLTRNQE